MPTKKKAQNLAPPRLTAWGWWYLFLYLVVPFLGALALGDALLYLFFQEVLGSCYGIFCLL